MNTANLQLEGLLLLAHELLRDLQRKSIITSEDISSILGAAERRALHEINGRPDLSDANALAILFPIAFLRRSLAESSEGRSFADIARDVSSEGRAQRW